MSTEIICGINAVYEVLRAKKRRVLEIFIAPGKHPHTVDHIQAEAKKAGVLVRGADREEIAKIARIEKNQGVAAKVERFRYTPVEEIIDAAIADDPPGFMVILDDIKDPQNLGSLTRTAHLTGAAGLVIPKDRSASVGPAATRAAAGATEYLPIAQVTNLANTLKYMKDKGFWVAGAQGESRDMLYGYDFTDRPHVIVMGGEGTGMRRLVKEKCDILLSIPMHGAVGSYNVSVAGALFMGEVNRQRWAKKPCKSHTF